MPLQATSGAASYDGFGGGVVAEPNYIESCFSTYLYTGNGATQTITNNIDLAGQGGLVWTKSRIEDGNFHSLFDTNRGTLNRLVTSTTFANTSIANSLQSFNSNGFSVGSSGTVNASTYNYVSWTFRKQPKFFDVVTYTGNGTTNDVANALASVPGFVVIKKTSTTSNWFTLNRDSSGNYLQGYLNTTGSLPQVWVAANTSTYLTSTTLKIASLASVTGEDMNASGVTYVAYLFAHDAGGFGLTGTDNVISCGSFTTDGTGKATVSLGYEPQWVLWKQTDGVDNWYLNDIMRGMNVSGSDKNLSPNTSAAESAGGYDTTPTATGFIANPGIASKTYIYIAIRRGPMKVPTSGTSVYNAVARTGTGADTTITGVGFASDLVMAKGRDGRDTILFDRLRGRLRNLRPTLTDAEQTESNSLTGFDVMDGVTLGADSNALINASGASMINWFFRRAPSFFDEVCYTGTGSATTFAHNLGVVPELMIVKNRVTGTNWAVYTSALGATKTLFLNLTNDPSTITSVWNDTAPTASVFTVGSAAATNTSTNTYVNYLFATCAGVSKVGSYTGTGTTQTINCGFTAGARFVLIKRTDSTGDWYVWDSARGIVSGNDPYLLLNSTAAEVTGTDYVDTAATGFEISSTAPAAINANGGSFIFFAVS
jgi:hypothetical protein